MINLGNPPISIPAFIALSATHCQPGGDLIWHVRQANGKFVPKRITPQQAVSVLLDNFHPVGVQAELWREKGSFLVLDVVNLRLDAVPGMFVWSMDCLFRPLPAAIYKRRVALHSNCREGYFRVEIHRPQTPNAAYVVRLDELPGYFRQYYGAAIFALDALISALNRTVRWKDTIPYLHPMLIPNKARLPLAVHPIRLAYFGSRDQYGLDDLITAKGAGFQAN